jgi:hypothetical protein
VLPVLVVGEPVVDEAVVDDAVVDETVLVGRGDVVDEQAARIAAMATTAIGTTAPVANRCDARTSPGPFTQEETTRDWGHGGFGVVLLPAPVPVPSSSGKIPVVTVF